MQQKKLTGIAENCIENPPSYSRRQGEDRKKRERKDLLGVYKALHKAECELSVFVTADLNKVSSIEASESDVCVLVLQIFDLTEVIVQLRVKVST